MYIWPFLIGYIIFVIMIILSVVGWKLDNKRK
jgi:hypothetical protein